jgi:diacylglycerol O-acyltransferase / wax synthase
MQRLTAEDQLMLWPDAMWPQDIGALAILDGSPLSDVDGRFRIDVVRRAVEARLHRVPRFRQVLRVPRWGLGPPLWVDAPDFDPARHIRVVPVPAPGDEAALLHAVESLRARRLDRSRPLWEMCFLTGLPDHRVGLYVRMHHAIADGIAGVATVGAFLDPVPDPPAVPAPPWTPEPWPTSRELFADTVRRHTEQWIHALSTLARPVATIRRLAAGWPEVRGLFARERTPGTSLDRMCGPDRTLAVLRTRLDVVKRVAHGHDAKVNDVLLAVTAAGLRALLTGRGEPVDTLPVYVPVTLRRPETRDRARGNLVAQMVVPLPLGETDPGRRLARIAAESATRKAHSHPSLGTMFHSRIARRVLVMLLRRQPVSVTTADVPGPPVPVYLAGARVLEVFPVLPLIASVSLGVGALSYAGQFTVTVVADRVACPDLDVFIMAARAELDALARSAPSLVPAQSL